MYLILLAQRDEFKPAVPLSAAALSCCCGRGARNLETGSCQILSFLFFKDRVMVSAVYVLILDKDLK